MRIKKSSLGVVIGLVLVCGLVLAEMVWAVVPTNTVEKARNATVLVATQNKYWAEWVPTSKNFWQIIPYVIQTGNNRYKVAVENGYTHISSVMFGTSVGPRAWNYLREELKKSPSQRINVGKQEGQSLLGNILQETQI